MMCIIRCNDNDISFNNIQMVVSNVTCVGYIVDINFYIIFKNGKVRYYNIYIFKYKLQFMALSKNITQSIYTRCYK